jgi:S1-C subfamily serine protease
MKHFRPMLFLVTVLMLASLACSALSGGGGSAPTQEPVSPATEAPATKPADTNNQGGAINSVDSVKDATIQIEAQGTFVDPQFGLQLNSAGRGSGFIIDPSGLAVTNNHVVAGAALVKVWVGGETNPRNAKVLGLSECSDLAVIQIEDGGSYPALNWYTDEVKPGLEVYAAGFPLGEPEYNLTKGIISKANADGDTDWASVKHVLGHDATINPGNSGGPLVTADGQVVGINYSGLQSANQYFAIGSDIAMPVIDELKTGKDVDSIGVNGTAVLSEDGSLSGIWVASVKSGSPADKTGIKPGDIIYQLEGLVLATDGTMKDYCDVIRSHSATDTLGVTVIRYATGELLEGQMNGRELAVTGNFDTSGAGGSSGGGGNTSSGGTEAQAYYTEEFPDGGDLSNYSYFEWHGEDAGYSTNVENDAFVFDITGENRWVYVTYDAYTYTDVLTEVVAENRGKNNNNVSLICRYDPDKNTWYEFNIANNGLYSILAFDGTDYRTIYNGGSKAIKQGKDTNTYSIGCVGDTLSLFINGVEARTVKDTQYKFKEGKVGFSVSSFNVTPILVDVNSFTIAEP